ncbi:MAG: ComEC/Rec2 family competence protein [Fermentimonas sp.]
MPTPTIFGKTPFLRLLIPVITGIAVAAYFPVVQRGFSFAALVGLLLMLLSFFLKGEWRYPLRWLFGIGASLFLFSIALLQYREHEKGAAPDFTSDETYYIGTLLDIPEMKPRSIACHVKIGYPVEKRVILYLQQSDQARTLTPGEELVFRARLQPFRNFGNPDEFNYQRFMKIKGIAGSAYVPTTNWQKTGRQRITLPILSQRCRAKVLTFFHSFQLDPDALAFISAITLGYKAYLSDDLQEAFRASGTAHVLAVSGLHVGIIYVIINFLFSFLGRRGRPFVMRQLLVILTLWAYALIAGMSAPITRAAFMLTIYCVGRIGKSSGFTYNTLAAAAFIILLFKPFSLFDVSFLMSFMAVFAILFFQPKLRLLYTPRHRVSKYFWELSTVSLSAQIGVFPLVLYFFGSFPTYFFLANLLVVPLISLVIYATVPLVAVSLFSFLQSSLLSWLETLFRWVLKMLINIVLWVVQFTETLPFAQVTDQYLSFPRLLFLLLFLYLFAWYLVSRRSRPLLVALTSLLLFFVIGSHERLTGGPTRLVVFNTPSTSEIAIFAEKRRHYVELPRNGLLPHPTKGILRLSDGEIERLHAEEPFPLHTLILSEYRYFNVNRLLNLFQPEVIVLDSSIPRYAARRLQAECGKLGVAVHDVTADGAYSIFY